MTELRHKSNRHIIKRIIVRGTLLLDTPTCLGSGDADSPTDLPLLRDSISNHALLTGSSIAGALRNYLRERNNGYQESDRRYDSAALLFGDLFSYKDEQNITDEVEKIKLREQDTQSPLIINDAISTQPIKAELRDGVKIKSTTGTAEKRAKYDLELLEAGTKFNLCFELLIDGQDKNENVLIRELAIALSGLEKGEISLGMKKRRGFGRCHVEKWQVWHFNLEDERDRTAWLLFDRECTNKPPLSTSKIADALGVVLNEGEDKRDRFTIHATFKLVGSLLIRSGQDSTGRAPDVVHLKSHRPNKSESQSILSGTSLAGVLRHRAERIVNTLEKPTTIIDEMFGPDFSKDKTKQAKASRLIVHEKGIENATDLVQNRIAIDRFTGGAYHGALFDEQPIFGSDQTIVTIELELRKPEKHDIGLLLILLKDLWTSDLPVGGESSIGRGRLQGIYAKMNLYKSGQSEEWVIQQQCDKSLCISQPEKLNSYVQELVDYPSSTSASDKETAA